MLRQLLGPVLSLMCLVVLLSACGSKAAAPKPTATPKVSSSTPVPAPLVAYGSFTDPLLKTAISQTNQMLALLNRPDFETLGDQCTLASGNLSNSWTAFRTLKAPTYSALAVYNDAKHGYHFILSGADECGMAADARSKSQVKIVYNDLRTGIGFLQHARIVTSQWQAGKT